MKVIYITYNLYTRFYEMRCMCVLNPITFSIASIKLQQVCSIHTNYQVPHKRALKATCSIAQPHNNVQIRAIGEVLLGIGKYIVGATAERICLCGVKVTQQSAAGQHSGQSKYSNLKKLQKYNWSGQLRYVVKY